jgi:hypothetical protein
LAKAGGGKPSLFLCFLVFRMLFAIPAVLADVQPVGIVFLVFHCCVVAPLAVTTGECEDDAVVFLGHGLKLLLGNRIGLSSALLALRQKIGGLQRKEPRKKHLLPGVNQAVYLYLLKPVNLRGIWRFSITT